MLNRHQVVLGFLLATAFWAIVLALQSEPSAQYQICETNQYTEQEHCTPHHLLYVALWYIGYVFNPVTITAYATGAIAWFTWTLKQSTDRLWRAGIEQLAHAQSESEAAEFHRKVQYDQTSEQIEALKQSADAAEQAARASVDQARASASQAKIAESALTQLERPYIFIFGVCEVREDGQLHEFFVEYTVVNYGKMPAIIDGAWIDFVPDNTGQPPIPTLLYEGHSLLSSPILQSGERRENIRAYAPIGMVKGSVGVITNTRTGAESACPNFDISEGFDIYFRATIRYHGPSSGGYETGALWVYNPSSFEFAPRGGEEYNYTR
jgi:hypothetical protein